MPIDREYQRRALWCAYPCGRQRNAERPMGLISINPCTGFKELGPVTKGDEVTRPRIGSRGSS
jgi:hypothetical protein